MYASFDKQFENTFQDDTYDEFSTIDEISTSPSLNDIPVIDNNLTIEDKMSQVLNDPELYVRLKSHFMNVFTPSTNIENFTLGNKRIDVHEIYNILRDFVMEVVKNIDFKFIVNVVVIVFVIYIILNMLSANPIST